MHIHMNPYRLLCHKGETIYNLLCVVCILQTPSENKSLDKCTEEKRRKGRGRVKRGPKGSKRTCVGGGGGKQTWGSGETSQGDPLDALLSSLQRWGRVLLLAVGLLCLCFSLCFLSCFVAKQFRLFPSVRDKGTQEELRSSQVTCKECGSSACSPGC